MLVRKGSKLCGWAWSSPLLGFWARLSPALLRLRRGGGNYQLSTQSHLDQIRSSANLALPRMTAVCKTQSAAGRESWANSEPWGTSVCSESGKMGYPYLGWWNRGDQETTCSKGLGITTQTKPLCPGRCQLPESTHLYTGSCNTSIFPSSQVHSFLWKDCKREGEFLVRWFSLGATWGRTTECCCPPLPTPSDGRIRP